MKKRHRLDEELVCQGLFETADAAARSVLAGNISTAGRLLVHPGEPVEFGIPLHMKQKKRYVSRGGLKLEKGLQEFKIDPTGRLCLDIGCSTGGFTDCLLKAGAKKVIACDVGRAQFSWRLRQDERVVLFERTNICDLPERGYKKSIELAVCDVSFTSIKRILSAVIELLLPGATFLTLVKPQFEAAKEDVGEKGIVSDPAVRKAVLEDVSYACKQAGLCVCGSCTSPIKGHKGNIEYLLYTKLPS